MAGLQNRFNTGNSQTVAELLEKARTRTSVNPHAGFNERTPYVPPQTTGGIGGNPQARFPTTGLSYGPPRGAGFGMNGGIGGNPQARFKDISYPGSDYNPYDGGGSMSDPTWAGVPTVTSNPYMPPQYGEVPHTTGIQPRYGWQDGAAIGNEMVEASNSPTTGPANKYSPLSVNPHSNFNIGDLTASDLEPISNGEDGGYLDDLISSWADGGMGYTDPFPGGMGMDPTWSPGASTPPGYTAPYGMEDPTFGAPQSKPTMTNPMLPDGGWPDQGDVGDSGYGGWADVQKLNDPGFGMVDPSWSADDTPFKFDPRNPGNIAIDPTQQPNGNFTDPHVAGQIFNHTNKLLEDARTEKAQTEAKELADKAAEEHAARFGGMDKETTAKRAEYIEKMNKMFQKQKIMMVLAAISGDPNIMRMAGAMAEIDMKQMDMEYGEFKNDNLRAMQQKFFFDKDGNYDPPKTTAEAWEALNAMGATPAEADAILGRMPEVEEPGESKNWVDANGNRVSSPTSPGPQWQEAGLAEGAKNPDAAGAGGFDLGVKGDQAMFLRNLEDKLALMPEGAAKEKAKKDVELFRLAFSMESPDALSNAQKTKLFETLYKDKNLGYVIDGKRIKDPQKAMSEWLNGTGRFAGKGFDSIFGSGDDTPANTDEPVKVTTKAEWEALPKGTVFIDGSGDTKTKE